VIRVDGTLIAAGTPANPIRLTSHRTPPGVGDWQGLIFTDTSTDAALDATAQYLSGSLLRHVLVEFGGGLFIQDSFPLIEASTFVQSTPPPDLPFPIGCCSSPGVVTAFYSSNTDATKTLVIRDSRFEDNQGRGISVGGGGQGQILIVGNTLVRNSGGLALGDFAPFGFALNYQVLSNTIDANTGPGIEIRNSGTNLLIEGNTITRNRASFSGAAGGGIAILSGSPLITNNRIAQNTDMNILPPGFPSGSAIFLSGGTPTITFNTIEENTATEATIWLGSGGAALHHNNIFNNTAPFELVLAEFGGQSPVHAEDNFWAETDPRAIALKVFDFEDTFGLQHGTVSFVPFLTALEPLAPPPVTTPPP
jgi:parallel beta-helix repeat protein